MTLPERMQLKAQISRLFTPGTPINKHDLFAGRLEQVNDVINATLQLGRHVVLFGERGVGKTSLARVISDILKMAGYHLLDCGTINCDKTDDFSSLWRKIFREHSFVMKTQDPGFTGNESAQRISLESISENAISWNRSCV